jgi:hypothetical protein
MGRGDQDKRVRRAREQIDKALARRDVESMVEAVLALDKAAREPLFALTSGVFRQTLSELQKTSAWARLHTLAARVEQEPRLLTEGADEAAAASARWPLFLACMRARDFARANRIWKFLVDKVTARAPALARAIATWIEGKGQISADAIADLDLDGLPALAVPDPRIGIEASGQPRPAPPSAPASAAQAEDALNVLFATQPLTVVADTLRTWLERAPGDIAKVLRTRAGSLTLRELLVHASSKESLALPAQLLARLSEETEDDLVSELLIASRLLMMAVVAQTPKRGESESLEAVAAALVKTKQFKDVAKTLARDFSRLQRLVPLALRVCQSALSSAASMPDESLFPLWVQALYLNAPPPEVDAEKQVSTPGPTWLQSASREVCKRGKALATYLERLDSPARDKLLDDLLWGQPNEIVSDLIDALWKDASEELRREISYLLPDLMEMAEETSMSILENSRIFGDMATFDRIAAAANKADPALPFLAAGGLAIWRRFGLRSLPYCVALVPFALSQASQPSQRIEVVKAYVGSRVDIEAWLESIRELSLDGLEMLPSLIDEIMRVMLDRFQDDRIALARALDYTVKFHAPITLVKSLGHAYQRAALAEDNTENTPEDERARDILALLFRGKIKKSPAKGRAKRRRKTTSMPDGSGAQLELPLGEDEP